MDLNPVLTPVRDLGEFIRERFDVFVSNPHSHAFSLDYSGINRNHGID